MNNYKKSIKRLGLLTLLMGSILLSMNCASGQKIDQTAPVELKGAYYQKWVAGIKEGGKGWVLYLPVTEDNGTTLTEAYFKGNKVDLKKKANEEVYTAKFTEPGSTKKDLVMHSDPKKEFGNELPQKKEKIPFELNNNECVIAYMKNGKKGYFKIDSLSEKQIQAYPMQPRQ